MKNPFVTQAIAASVTLEAFIILLLVALLVSLWIESTRRRPVPGWAAVMMFMLLAMIATLTIVVAIPSVGTVLTN